MTIHWYPGHMNKARRDIGRAMRSTDVVIEVRDARLPRSSANPVLEELRRDLPCVRVLNKADLADPVVTKAWLEVLGRPADVRCLALSATGGKGQKDVKRIPKLCASLAPGRTGPGKAVRALVVGIPNVGKSTLINSLKGRRVADVENRPAVTRRTQQVVVDLGFTLNDTPGMLWPRLDDQQAAHRLAASGGVGEAAYDVADVARFAAELLAERYPELLRKRYKLDALPADPDDLMPAIARARGFLLRGGELDIDRAAETLLRELRSGHIGRITLETP